MDAVGYVPDAEITRILAEGGANLQDANKSGWTPLHFAMREEAEILKILLEFRKDIDLEKRDNRGETPLLWGDSMQCITLLVRAGADINTTGGKYGTALATACANLNLDLSHTIYNALSAASLSAGVSIVNYLLHSGASPDRVDPLGRLPIHFAAINGVENFKALALVHSGGLMVTDCAGKNVLHWAAQYEHVETIEFILDSLGSREEREHYINKPDIDGWTPLCWATRPLYEHFIHYKVSESLAYDGTIKYLLEHGADRHVEFNIGTGPEAETFTPVEMAKRYNAGEEIINLLTSDNSGEEDKDFRIYKQGRGFCDICLNSIFGYLYKCNSCLDFDACKKCYGRINLYHDHIKAEDGEPHQFEIRNGYEKEFEDPLADREGSQGSISYLRPIGHVVDEIDGLDAVDLDDLEIMSEATLED
ncbi:putative ankyrin repeat-containing protein [Eutypa lata UCREL1]|uniref:Putative ankyrin repeat-containing protein n=1 Tax=Eutypa lata (strain UCR-EL1) TaxID=1287681 RepID=M7SLF7_EUTLA|nr:putative ankyrin repeat-containing protein [Eutypa lata UCREL1]